jgi:iron(III) transport system permease protein
MLFLVVLALFFGLFLLYPVGLLLKGAFSDAGRFTLKYFGLLLSSPLQRESLFNSFAIATLTTVLTTLLVMPLASVLTRFDFRGKAFLNALLLIPMIMPPFVGAIGLKQLLARFGSVNLMLTDLGIISANAPIDWLGHGGFWGIVILQVLNLYPIMLLNVSAAMANVDPSLREAAQNLGASPWRLFRTVTLPLISPGYFAGAIIVFIWAFTDLGTPLVFGFSRVVPVQIFDAVNEINTNPLGYALVVFVLVLTVVLFATSKRVLARRRYEMLARSGIPALIDAIKLWHPDIAVGGGSCYLREDFYHSRVCLDGDAEKEIYVGYIKLSDELEGMWSLEQEHDALSL